jgi:hypothetical protein
VTDKQRAAVERAAQRVLDVLAEFLECGDLSPLFQNAGKQDDA